MLNCNSWVLCGIKVPFFCREKVVNTVEVKRCLFCSLTGTIYINSDFAWQEKNMSETVIYRSQSNMHPNEDSKLGGFFGIWCYSGRTSKRELPLLTKVTRNCQITTCVQKKQTKKDLLSCMSGSTGNNLFNTTLPMFFPLISTYYKHMKQVSEFRGAVSCWPRSHSVARLMSNDGLRSSFEARGSTVIKRSHLGFPKCVNMDFIILNFNHIDGAGCITKQPERGQGCSSSNNEASTLLYV